MQELVELIAKALVDNPDKVQVSQLEDNDFGTQGCSGRFGKGHRKTRPNSQSHQDYPRCSRNEIEKKIQS